MFAAVPSRVLPCQPRQIAPSPLPYPPPLLPLTPLNSALTKNRGEGGGQNMSKNHLNGADSRGCGVCRPENRPIQRDICLAQSPPKVRDSGFVGGCCSRPSTAGSLALPDFLLRCRTGPIALRESRRLARAASSPPLL